MIYVFGVLLFLAVLIREIRLVLTLIPLYFLVQIIWIYWWGKVLSVLIILIFLAALFGLGLEKFKKLKQEFNE